MCKKCKLSFNMPCQRLLPVQLAGEVMHGYVFAVEYAPCHHEGFGAGLLFSSLYVPACAHDAGKSVCVLCHLLCITRYGIKSNSAQKALWT